MGVLPHKNLGEDDGWFQTTSHFDRKYLWNGCDLSRVCWRNLVNFGPQTSKNRTLVQTHWQSTFSKNDFSAVRGRFHLKFSHTVENDQVLLTHPQRGLGAPTFLGVKNFALSSLQTTALFFAVFGPKFTRLCRQTRERSQFATPFSDWIVDILFRSEDNRDRSAIFGTISDDFALRSRDIEATSMGSRLAQRAKF